MKTKETAAQACQRNQDNVGALCDLLAQETRMHSEHARKEGVDWATVGDLAEVRRQMIQTLAFLAQQDESFIENHLAELRAGRK